MSHSDPLFTVLISAALLVAGCATDSGFGICRAQSDKERAAEKRAEIHESLAQSYRLSRDEYLAFRHEEQAGRERAAAARERDSNLLGDLIFAILGNCDR